MTQGKITRVSFSPPCPENLEGNLRKEHDWVPLEKSNLSNGCLFLLDGTPVFEGNPKPTLWVRQNSNNTQAIERD